uniref:Interferon-related developmental regulator N-terminal domain-containing protein n=1 Tax=Brassica oleracea var. oleracea TaxID=109376 RepID=A0A0D3D6D3_BRAOL
MKSQSRRHIRIQRLENEPRARAYSIEVSGLILLRFSPSRPLLDINKLTAHVSFLPSLFDQRLVFALRLFPIVVFISPSDTVLVSAKNQPPTRQPPWAKTVFDPKHLVCILTMSLLIPSFGKLSFTFAETQRKNARMDLLDSDDDTSSISSSSTMQSERPGMDEVQVHKDVMLDQSLDALYEQRSSTREQALASILNAFNSDLQHEFVEKKFATLLHQCLHCIKKGSIKETSLASHVIGLLALTVGLGDQAQEILEESVTPLSQALKSGREALKITSILECLAVITFVGGANPEQTERSMQIIWQMIHPKLGSNVVATKPSPAVITTVVSSWAFLLTTVDRWTLGPKLWQEIVTYLSSLLEKDDRSVRIAAGEALALIFELRTLEKFAAEAKGSTANGSVKEGSVSQEALMNMHGVKSKVTNQVRDLAAEAGGKGSAKKDLNTQRSLFKDLVEFLENGVAPETSTKVGGDSLQTSTWYQMIQLNFLKHFLGGGFIKHMQENEFLHDVFSFTPKKIGGHSTMSSEEKRLFKSPNSALNKARTLFLNKQRMLAKNMNDGHYAAMVENE